ncbi:MAG: hypothetical protein PVI57_18405 [Gemmatimonadota bacterium]|jgi:hypothetical protein
MSLAYFGPEVVAPIASLAAGLLGVLLLFWRRAVAGVKRAFRRVTGWFLRDADGGRRRTGRGDR